MIIIATQRMSPRKAMARITITATKITMTKLMKV